VTPSVSVVIAAHNAGGHLADCLRAVGPQCQQLAADCVVVATGRPPPQELIDGFAPVVRSIWDERDRLVPELWSRGIRATGTDIVALTTAECVPAADWLEQVVKAPWDEISAMGGPLELQRPSTLRTEAIFYQRYSGYLLPRDRGLVGDLAADNVAYRRDALMVCADHWWEAFWEPTVHRQLRARGERLLFNPDMLMYFRHHGPVWDMAKQRYWHGWWFAAQRIHDSGAAERWLRVVTAPAVPGVLLVRIVKRIAAKRRLSPRLILALPVLWLYLLSWSVGEFRGYLQGCPPRP
jgi:hypothetical protein